MTDLKMNIVLIFIVISLIVGSNGLNNNLLRISSNSINRHTEDDVETSTEFLLYTKLNTNWAQIIPANEDMILRSFFNPSWPTRFIIHGLQTSSHSYYMRNIKDAYLEKGNFNIFAVNWVHKSRTPIMDSQVDSIIRFHGNIIGNFAINLSNLTGVPIRNMYLIGQGLGSHIAGYAGRYVQLNTPEKSAFGAIFGLDPSGFSNIISPKLTLSKSDAIYVESIETNTDRSRSVECNNMAHALFFPNFGYDQPGCWTNMCSHYRSMDYFIESIRGVKKFYAKQCLNYTEISAKTCSATNNNDVIMGDGPIENKKPGIFYVPVRTASPYAYGKINVDDLIGVKLYNANMKNGFLLSPEDIPSVEGQFLNRSWPVRFLICDYSTSNNNGFVDEICLQIKNAYLRKGNFNIFTFNWYYIIKEKLYGKAVVPSEIGKTIADLTRNLTSAYNIPYENIDVVGEGVGAYLASLASKRLGEHKFNTIFALDYDGILDQNSANYIESIQTSSTKHNGHASIIVNYGQHQTECSRTDKTCKHIRSVQIFIETILKNNLEAVAIVCQDYDNMSASTCEPHGPQLPFGGVNATHKANGVYHSAITNTKGMIPLMKDKAWINFFAWG